jgi:hypothetical protein
MWSQGDRVACGVITDDTKVSIQKDHKFAVTWLLNFYFYHGNKYNF